MTRLMVGAFYNAHLGAELAALRPGVLDHLAMADPPAASDPHWPAVRERYTLLLHDYLGQLSEPLDERSIARARSLAELYRSPWVAEHFQCLHTEDGSYNLNYVFPPLYTEEFLERFVRNACALKARLDQPLVMENIPGFFDGGSCSIYRTCGCKRTTTTGTRSAGSPSSRSSTSSSCTSRASRTTPTSGVPGSHPRSPRTPCSTSSGTP